MAQLEIDPNDPGIHYNLGVLYEEDIKSAVKAKHHYERFLQVAPDDPAAGDVRTWLMTL